MFYHHYNRQALSNILLSSDESKSSSKDLIITSHQRVLDGVPGIGGPAPRLGVFGRWSGFLSRGVRWFLGPGVVGFGGSRFRACGLEVGAQRTPRLLVFNIW